LSLRRRILVFFGVVFTLLLIFLGSAVFWQFRDTQLQIFRQRLKQRALLTARIFIDATPRTASELEDLRRNYDLRVADEIVEVIDEQDKVVFLEDNQEFHISKAELTRARKRGEWYYQEGDREVAAIAYADKKGRYVVVSTGVDVVGREKQLGLLEILVGSLLVVLSIGLSLGYMFINRTISPLDKLVKQIESLSGKRMDQRLQLQTGIATELIRLGQSFNELLDRVQRSFESQKGFVANASHELRTPLTSLVGELEIALMYPRDTGDYVEIINRALEDTRRLSTLTNNLLLLAQFEAGDMELELEPIQLDTLLITAVDRLLRMHPDAKLNIDLRLPDSTEQLLVHGRFQLLKNAILNLLTNAVKYSPSEEAIIIQAWRVEDTFVITITDKGAGMSVEELKIAFDPFYRASSSYGKEGFGIGLPLTRRIIEVHKGKVWLEAAPGQGIRATVHLPAA
jgi:signal transduction histidine kinase